MNRRAVTLLVRSAARALKAVLASQLVAIAEGLRALAPPVP